MATGWRIAERPRDFGWLQRGQPHSNAALWRPKTRCQGKLWHHSYSVRVNKLKALFMSARRLTS